MSAKKITEVKKAVINDGRCKHLTASGRQCTALAARDTSRVSGYSTFCLAHSQQEQQYIDSKKVAAELIGDLDDFRTYHAVTEVLGKLLILLANNRIPLRNANSIAYICQLLLTCAPGVRQELRLQGGIDEQLRVIKCTTALMWGENDGDKAVVEEEEETEEEGETEDDQQSNEAPQQTVAARHQAVLNQHPFVKHAIEVLNS